MRIAERIRRINLDLDKRCTHVSSGSSAETPDQMTDDQAAQLLDSLMAPCPDCGARPTIADLATMADDARE